MQNVTFGALACVVAAIGLASCQTAQDAGDGVTAGMRRWAGCCGQRMVVTGDAHHFVMPNGLTVTGMAIPEGYADEVWGQGLVASANLPPGPYTVEVAGAENVFEEPGKRVFDVTADGIPLQKNVDLFAETGATGKVYTVKGVVQHKGGELRVVLAAKENNAKFSAIRIIDSSGAKVAWALAQDMVGIQKALAEKVPVVRGPVIWTDWRKPMETRVADLVARMSLQEKVGQLMNAAPAIDRLGLPAYNYWNECLHGVARAGNATVFPQAIGMAASWDPTLLHEVADTISTEARAKHEESLKNNQRDIYMGLTFWTPNINIFRDPRWGRGQETYGEDPFLTGTLGVAFITGLQGDDPQYYKLVATAKHYAVHNGPEILRHTFDVSPSERDFYETYLPQFEMAVKQAHVYSVMGAYNDVYGVPACASDLLLRKILRDDWGFDGYVVSDCGAITDVWWNHHAAETRAQGAAMSLKAGCDLECGKDYSALTAAVAMGLLSEKDIDVALSRVLLARFKLGMFDPPERVKWAQIPISENDSSEHSALALEMAHKSMVLLKNDAVGGGQAVLPLRKDLKKIAVVGPNADSLLPLLGNYTGTPSHPVMVLDGIRAAVPGTQVEYVRGCDIGVRKESPELVPDVCLRFGAATGLRGEYFDNEALSGVPVAVRQDKAIDFNGSMALTMGGVPTKACGVRWTGEFVAPADGTYALKVDGGTPYRLLLGGKVVEDTWDGQSDVPEGVVVEGTKLTLKAGEAVPIVIEAHEDSGNMQLELVWDQPSMDTGAAVAERVKDADAIIFVGGLDGRIEQEEGPGRASFEGFFFGDRTAIELPSPQTKLMQALVATGKPVVFVNMTGSAVAMPWEKEHVPAILQAWYPGENGGKAVADVLFGDYNPSGRLPVTFYAATSDLPPFTDYAMNNRTYQHFTGKPLWPFGFGLSYTTFRYGNVGIDKPQTTANDNVIVSVDVTNKGQRDGEEVVQIYARALHSKVGMPLRKLVAFTRLPIAAGQTVHLQLPVQIKELQYWDTAKQGFVVEPGTYALEVGASAGDVRGTCQVEVK